MVQALLIYRDKIINPPGVGGGTTPSDPILIDHTFADRAARDAFYTTDPNAADNLDALVQGETVILILDNGVGDSVVELWAGTSDPPTYDNTDWVVKITHTQLTVIDNFSIVSNELRSALAIRAPEFRANTGSLLLGDSALSFAGSGLEISDPINDRVCGIIQKVVGTDRAIEYVDTAEKTVDIQTAQDLAGPGDFTVNYTVTDETGREGVRVTGFTVIPSAEGVGELVIRKDDENGSLLLSQFIHTFVLSEVGNETNLALSDENAFRIEDGTTVHVTYTGAALRGSTVQSNYFPFLRVRDQDYTEQEIARLSDVTTTAPIPSLHGLSIDIASRVDLNTDLNVGHTVTFSVTNHSRITALTLVVTTGTDQTLTLPVTDGSQSQSVTLAGIDTTGTGSVTFQLSGTHAGGTVMSNTVIVQIRDVQPHEYIYINHQTSDQASAFSTTGANQYEISNPQTIIIPTYSNAERVVIAQPATESDILELVIDNVNQRGGFTKTDDAVQINSQNYDVYLSNNPLLGSVVSGERIEVRR